MSFINDVKQNNPEKILLCIQIVPLTWVNQAIQFTIEEKV